MHAGVELRDSHHFDHTVKAVGEAEPHNHRSDKVVIKPPQTEAPAARAPCLEEKNVPARVAEARRQ